MRKTNHMIVNRLKRAVENDVPDLLPQLLQHIEEEGDKREMTKAIIRSNEVLFEEEKSSAARFRLVKLMSIVVAGLLLLIGSYSGYMHYTPQSTINFDVNPSIEVSINRAEKILKVTPLNEEAAAVIGDMDLRKVDLDIAVNALIGSMIKNGYIDEMKNSILITVDSKDASKGAKLQERIADEINTLLETYALDGSILSQNAENDEETKKIAKEYGISLGKAALIKKLAKDDPSIEYSDLAGLSVNDIKLIMEANKSKPAGIKSSGQASSKKYIGSDKALAIALGAAKVSETSISKLEIELDYEDGRMVYEVEFYVGSTEYEYEIDAIRGDIVESKVKSKDKPTKPSHHSPASKHEQTSTSEEKHHHSPSTSGNIGNSKALQIALSHAGLSQSQVSDIDIELDYEDGILVYEVEFDYKGREYEYEINAKTGQIVDISYD